MLPEREIIFKSNSLSEQMTKPLISKATKIFLDRVEQKVAGAMQPEYAEGFDLAFTQAMQVPDVLPILISNHEGHADIIPMALISQKLTNNMNLLRGNRNFRGFMLTIAASLETGHQNWFLQEGIRQTKAKLPDYYLSTEPFVRKEDKERYGIKPNNVYYMRTLKKIAAKDNERKADGLAFFPQGSIESGRSIKIGKGQGKMKGMQRFNCSELYELIQGIESRHQRKVLIIPIGSHGAGNVVNPDHRRPTLKTLVELVKEHPKSLMQVKVGLPIRWDSLSGMTAEDFGNFLGKTIAALLPTDARGVYG